jgi:phospholipid/cholesterol/gamma-HCH transport system substrate-binding protein
MRARIAALLAAAALVLSGCGFSGLYGVSLPGGADTGNNPMSLTAYFADVLDLVPQSAVKFHDVAVGKVTDIALAECPNVSTPAHKVWCAQVKMEVRDSVRLPSNARAEIKQTSLLGEKYVALVPPSGAQDKTRLASGDTIKYVDTSSAPEVEEVLGALSLLLNNGGLNQIRTIAHEMNSALHGNESTIRDLLGQMNTFVGTLDAQKQDIINALSSVDTLAKTLNQQKQVLVDALDTYPAALRVLSAERGKLTTLLTSLSNLGGVATRVINATQQGLVSSLKALAPSVEALVSAGDSFPKALKIMGTFPFPVGTTRTLVKGDYANLYAYVNLDLGTILCQGGQIPKALCNLLPQSNNSGKTAGKTSSQQATRLPPQLIGAGR